MANDSRGDGICVSRKQHTDRHKHNQDPRPYIYDIQRNMLN